MSLLHCTDHPIVLSTLFTEDIYLIPDKKPDPNTPVQKKVSPAEIYFEYLGENNTYFLIVIADKKHPQIAPITLQILLKIMLAKGLTEKDLAIVNYANYPGVTFNELKAFFACTKIALLGINPQHLQLPPIAANQPETIQQVKVLTSYSIEEMQANETKKRQFWHVMKNF